MLKKFLRFFTSTVFVVFIIGCAFIIIGQSDALHYLLPNIISEDSSINTIVRSIGAAFIGSGVFTAIIKSSEYTEIFSNVLGEIIWTKKYIEKRGDKKQIWSMVSRLMYDEKFPAISNEIEEIITDHYFPVAYNFYIENYEFIINISNIQGNNSFWKQEETIHMKVKPTDSKEKIIYRFTSNIDLPDDPLLQDITDYKIDSLFVNGIDANKNIAPTKKDTRFLHHVLELELQHSDEYEIIIKRSKFVCKKTNPDKRFFVSYIIKDAKVTIIMDSTMNVDFHKMGTIKDFVKSDEQINNGVKVVSWNYNGILLPHQGYIIIFK